MITKPNNASIVAGSMLIPFGLLALAGQLFAGWSLWGSAWPLTDVQIKGKRDRVTQYALSD